MHSRNSLITELVQQKFLIRFLQYKKKGKKKKKKKEKKKKTRTLMDSKK